MYQTIRFEEMKSNEAENQKKKVKYCQNCFID